MLDSPKGKISLALFRGEILDGRMLQTARKARTVVAIDERAIVDCSASGDIIWISDARLFCREVVVRKRLWIYRVCVNQRTKDQRAMIQTLHSTEVSTLRASKIRPQSPQIQSPVCGSSTMLGC